LRQPRWPKGSDHNGGYLRWRRPGAGHRVSPGFWPDFARIADSVRWMSRPPLMHSTRGITGSARWRLAPPRRSSFRSSARERVPGVPAAAALPDGSGEVGGGDVVRAGPGCRWRGRSAWRSAGRRGRRFPVRCAAGTRSRWQPLLTRAAACAARPFWRSRHSALPQHQVRTLITLGSPLGIRALITNRLKAYCDAACADSHRISGAHCQVQSARLASAARSRAAGPSACRRHVPGAPKIRAGARATAGAHVCGRV
jgi:hypothetical protein